MMNSFRKVAAQLTEQSGVLDRAPCRTCDEPTPRAALGNFGGTCFRCYEEYCGQAYAKQPLRNDTPTQREMRKHLRGIKPVNVLHRDVVFDSVDLEAKKRAEDRRVAEYARQHGIPLA
jgi:hypothetical protein